MEEQYPTHIKIAYSFHYDVNMIARDFTQKQKERLGKGEWIKFAGYSLRWLRGKWLELRHGETYTKIYDVFAFFGSSFITACRSYLNGDPDIDEIVEGKAARDTFEYEEMETFIKPYCEIELRLLVKLMNKVRELLAEADIYPASWHGPGALAVTLLQKHKIKSFRPVYDDEYVTTASRYAYGGGRFEVFKTGLYENELWQYDINSAYPYALTQVPELTGKYWKMKPDSIPDNFSLCRIKYRNDNKNLHDMNPFQLRSKTGGIFYPGWVETWVWGIEYNTAMKYHADQIELIGWLKFEDNGNRPFAFIEDSYDQRLQWKHEENEAQKVLKLALNSLYGKLAQRVGFDKDLMTAPVWHQLRWAGFTTATCRAMMYDAMMKNPDAIISIETDGIFSESPLDLNIGEGLGQFEVKHYDAIVYVQSGVYYTRIGNAWSEGKTRGFAANKHTNVELVLGAVEGLKTMTTVQHKFMGLPGALTSANWRHWVDQERHIIWGGNGKRSHVTELCEGCNYDDIWHDTVYVSPDSPISNPHKLPWLP